MRHLAMERLDACGLGRLAQDAGLVVSELVTNAVTHTQGTQVMLTISHRDGVLHIMLDDGTPARAMLKAADSDDEHGRGLQLVDWVASAYDGAWGCTGATTWCALHTGPVTVAAVASPVRGWEPPTGAATLSHLLQRLHGWEPVDGEELLDDVADALDGPGQSPELAQRLEGHLSRLVDIAVATKAGKRCPYTARLIERARSLAYYADTPPKRHLPEMGWTACELLEELVTARHLRSVA